MCIRDRRSTINIVDNIAQGNGLVLSRLRIALRIFRAAENGNIAVACSVDKHASADCHHTGLVGDDNGLEQVFLHENVRNKRVEQNFDFPAQAHLLQADFQHHWIKNSSG